MSHDSAPSDRAVRTEVAGNGVQVLTIDRPHRRNALDEEAYRELAAGIRSADDADDIRVSIITGSGGVFCSGNDLADFRRAGKESLTGGWDLLDALVDARKPVISAVEGFAIGVGVTVLLLCDLGYAGRSTRFRLPFVPLGLCPEAGSSYLLPQVAGHKKAAELLLLGDEFDASSAASAGIVNAAVEDGLALSAALDAAARIAGLPRGAVESTKSLLRAPARDTIRQVMRTEAVEFSARLRSAETQQVLAQMKAGR